ncbi:hypothetical protein [Neotamlana laminarinivorans]|uniref:Uncharacterized protein n=1 Tax=Neotamlana laminarinivorans TaxID=2883124 RepID=A0A9X1I3B5_9FLAO|nr:hypothetical protein [Tamlana laminarinivorans]MCB4799442.1 hypothetical protein [Tamlana laminarinivorans]
MKLKRIFKITLLIFCILIAGLFNFALFYFVFGGGFSFKNRQFLLVAVAFTGISSVIYHIKTLPMYKPKAKKVAEINYVLWVLNGLFALAVLYLAIRLWYDMFYKVNWKGTNEDYLIILLFFIPMLFTAISILIEERVLYNIIITSRKHSHFNKINQIGTKQHNENSN